MPIFLSRCLGRINKGQVVWRVLCRVVIPSLLRDPEGCITHGLVLPWGSGWHDSRASLSWPFWRSLHRTMCCVSLLFTAWESGYRTESQCRVDGVNLAVCGVTDCPPSLCLHLQELLREGEEYTPVLALLFPSGSFAVRFLYLQFSGFWHPFLIGMIYLGCQARALKKNKWVKRGPDTWS